MPQRILEKYRYIIYLADVYRSGEITVQERRDLDNWLEASSENQLFFEELMNSDNQEDAVKFMHSIDTAKALKELRIKIKENRKHSRKKLVASLLVASVFIGALLLFAKYFNINSEIDYDKNQLTQVDSVLNQDKVVLIMQSGEAIVVEENEENALAERKDSNILYEKGRVTYLSPEKVEKDQVVSFNTIITPKGGKYEVVLSDGTLVYLNTASRLIYPTSFSGNERKVKLEGEAYFEVAHLENKPFIVETNKQDIKVLGTHFNVKAYVDDAYYHTSLIEGSVEVKSKESGLLLEAGEEAILNIKSGTLNKRAVPVKNMALWKKSIFYFNNEPIHEVMKVISRWYNVEVVYSADLTNELFTGEVSRYLALNDVLKTLELTGKVTFKINKNGKVNVSK